MSYGNPSKLNRYEEDVLKQIRETARVLKQRIVEHLGVDHPSIREEPAFYYGDHEQPLRFLETAIGHNIVLRIAIQRNKTTDCKKCLKWTCYATVFSDGKAIVEEERDCRNTFDIDAFVVEVLTKES